MVGSRFTEFAVGRLTRFTVGLTVCAALGSATALAESAGARLTVQVRVAATATLLQRDTPAFVELTAAERASREVTVPATLTVRSNDGEGYLLSVWPLSDWFESVSIAGSGIEAQLAAEGGSIVRRTGGAALDRVALEFTFRLREGRELPVTLPWPLELQVAPL